MQDNRKRYPGPPPGAKLLDSGSTNTPVVSADHREWNALRTKHLRKADAPQVEAPPFIIYDEVAHVTPEQWAELFKRYPRTRRAKYIKVDYRR